MTQLRRLVDNAPGRTIELAEGGRSVFQAALTPRALVDDREGAGEPGAIRGSVREARQLVRTHRDNVWALDAMRHLLVHPLDLSRA